MGCFWLGIGLVLLAIFLMLPVRLRVEFAYCKNADRKRLRMWICGVRFLQNDFEKNLEKKQAKPKKEKPENDEAAFDGFMDKIRHYTSLLEALKDDVLSTLHYLKKKLCVSAYTMHLDLGFSDAAQTGIASGAAYALVYSIAALIYNNLNLKKKDLDVYVTPHYEEAKLDFYFNGIFQFRIVHIIKVLHSVLRLYRKYKKFTNKTKEGGGLV